MSFSYLNESHHRRDNFLMPRELERLLEAAQETRGKFYLPSLILLAAEHGASKQECFSLKWMDILFSDKHGDKIRFYRHKNRKKRLHPLMSRTKQALQLWLSHLKAGRIRLGMSVKVTENVFCRINGEPIRRFDKAWRSACRIAGFEDLHFHDLRHTYCSNLYMSGASLLDVQDMIGHSDLDIVERYIHLSIVHRQEVQNRMKGYLEGHL
jgi:integrase